MKTSNKFATVLTETPSSEAAAWMASFSLAWKRMCGDVSEPEEAALWAALVHDARSDCDPIAVAREEFRGLYCIK